MSSRPERRVLVLTGRLCSRKIAELLAGQNVDVLELPIDVACLMTSRLIQSELARRDLSRYDFVLLPGAVRLDLEELERIFSVPFYLGPIHYSDLPLILEALDEQELSRCVPADLLMKERLKERVTELFAKARRISGELPASSILIGSGDSRIPVGRPFPPSIIGEIVDLPRKSTSAILQEAQLLAASGAAIVDLGMTPGEDHPELIRSMVPLVRQTTGTPVSVDTMREKEILAAADAGADLILSVCGETLDLVASLEPPVVVVPLEAAAGPRPGSSSERLELLARYSEALGDHDVIVDPLLDPIGLGFSESLRSFLELPSRVPDRPSLMGVANVVELADVDSIGMNATLAAIAVESGVSLLLTTEASPKTRGSVSELRRACLMMFYSVRNRVPPKNLGMDLLMCKEKMIRSYPVALPSKRVRASAPAKNHAGNARQCFHIVVLDSHIHVICRLPDGEVDVIGTSAEEIANELAAQGLLPDPGHALYLGKELAKAELALAMGRSYIQDEPLFQREFDDGKPSGC